MARLSPALKSLLLNSPAGLSKPTPDRLRAVYRSIAEEAVAKGLAKPVWVSALTAATVGFNSPTSLIEIYNASIGLRIPTSSDPTPAANSDFITRLETATQIRETGLKCISFVGIPTVINHLTTLNDDLPSDISKALNPLEPSKDTNTTETHLPTSPYNLHPFSRRLLSPTASNDLTATLSNGIRLWESIYHPVDEKLVYKLSSAHPDLASYILQCHYGGLLSVPHSSSPPISSANLDIDSTESSAIIWGYNSIGRIETSISAITCLRTVPGAGPQLISHVHGLRKGIFEYGRDQHQKRTGDTIKKATSLENGDQSTTASSSSSSLTWLATDEGISWLVGLVDRVGRVLNAETTSHTKPKL